MKTFYALLKNLTESAMLAKTALICFHESDFPDYCLKGSFSGKIIIFLVYEKSESADKDDIVPFS